MRGACRAKRLPPASHRPSKLRGSRRPASWKCSSGACSCQPLSSTCQRASRLARSKATGGEDSVPSGILRHGLRAPNASGASSARLRTSMMRWASMRAHRSTLPEPATTRPVSASSGDQSSSRSASPPAHSGPDHVPRSRSTTAVIGVPPTRAQACTPALSRAPLMRSRRSTRGSDSSRRNAGDRTTSFARSTCSSPRASSVSSGSTPGTGWNGRPTMRQRRSAPCSRASDSSRTLSSVSGAPGRKPEYTATSSSARPMSSRRSPSPMRSPSSVKRGPRRVHSARAWVKVTGWPTRSLSQVATFCGLRSTSGSIWFTTPTAAAARISTTNSP